MASFKFNLKDSKSKKETLIYLMVRFDYQRIKYSTGEKIIPVYWDHENQRVKKSYSGHREFNARLNNIRTDAEDVCRRLINDGKLLTPSLVKEELDSCLRTKTHRNTRDKRKRGKSFIDFFNLFIEERQNIDRPNTIKKYKTTLKHIQSYESKRNKLVNFNSVTIDFYHDFVDYLYNDLDLNTNSVGKYIRVLKTVLNEATDRGINSNLDYNKKAFKVVSESVEKMFLSREEIDKIYNHDFSSQPRLEKIRDLFIIECNTGFRFSDISTFNPLEHIEKTSNGEIITLTQVKTNTQVSVPLHYQVKEILQKYNGQLPPPISNQKTNEYIKEICELAGITKLVTVKRPKAGKVTVKRVPKFTQITTHTSRRSFATNMYLAGFSSATIKAFTGHKTESAFLSYIGAGSRDVALNIADHKYFTGKDNTIEQVSNVKLKIAK